MDDVRNVNDALKGFGNHIVSGAGAEKFWRESQVQKVQLAKQRPMQCVKIRYKVDIELLQQKQFVPLKVPENHPELSSIPPCPISKKLGLPIVM